MRIVGVVLISAFAVLVNAGWCLSTCCPPATAAASPTGTLAAPACCSPATTAGVCPPSLHHSTSPAFDSARTLEGNPTILTASVAFAKAIPPARVGRSTSSPPPPQRALPALHAQLLI